MALKSKGNVVYEKPVKDEREIDFMLREPREPTAFDLFSQGLEDDQRPFARQLFQMACKHEWEITENTSSIVNGVEPVHVFCPRCSLMVRWQGTYAKTRQSEWRLSCPDGFDMFDWEELFTRKKEMWPLIFDEVLCYLHDDTMKEDQ